ncbi:biopolymer transporter ExbB [Tabrizicola sp.]|uniref:biopolymer transporter ExbB n=1 Tax=Tabrizicola sp. TaxID=2005166 RepID=UPI0035AEE2F0
MSQPYPQAAVTTTFSQPIRAITQMLLVCLLVGAGAWAIHGQIIDILRTNPLLNGLIAFVFAIGVLTCFWQVWILAQSVYWIENFVRATPGSASDRPPLLLAPLASLLRTRTARMSISATSSRSIQDSVVQRIDEARDITRYLINLLVFLGLLGTFWGLATTVPAVVETIRSLAPREGESGLDVFAKLMGGLESQLGGMGTAFSSSLLGLAGSLVLGLLELFAGHGQNRFTRELEEWLSSITRIGFAGEGEGGDQSAVAAMIDHMALQVEQLQAMHEQAEAGRGAFEARIAELTASLTRLGARPEGQGEALLQRIADGQDRLIATLAGEGPGSGDAESRMRLRSIDVQLLRILEEMSAGRQESIADLKADLLALTNAVRQLGRGAGR